MAEQVDPVAPGAGPAADRAARPELDEAPWRPWIEHVCAAVGVDPALVSVQRIHGLTQAVAQGVARPMAPVAAHVWGLALGAHPDADPDAVRAALLAVAGAPPGAAVTPASARGVPSG